MSHHYNVNTSRVTSRHLEEGGVDVEPVAGDVDDHGQLEEEYEAAKEGGR